MSVAPSFQALPQVGEPFEENGKAYVYVLLKNGNQKKVRWYEEPIKEISPLKNVLGFSKGYITIFKGDIEPLEDWFRNSSARYHKFFGWYFISDEPLPQLPLGVTPVQLNWDDISINGSLKPESAIRQHIESLIYEPSVSIWQGEIGERIERTVTVLKEVPLENNNYGQRSFFLLQDDQDNEYGWVTSASKLACGKTYTLRGTIKALQIYHNIQQTILTNCREVK